MSDDLEGRLNARIGPSRTVTVSPGLYEDIRDAAQSLTEARAEIERLRAKPPLLDAQSLPGVDALVKTLEAQLDEALRSCLAEREGRLKAEAAISTLRAEIERLEAVEKAKAQEWFCDTLGEIGFVGIRDYAAMQARADAAESELVTLRARASELASENTDLRNDLVQRGMAEESLRARVRGVVGPFAEAAANICDQSSDNSHIWKAPCAMSITRGHLRAARQLMEEVK